MLELFKQIVIGQFEAALCMLNACVENCAEEHWEGKIAQGPFRWVAYHTLFFTDLYLSPSENAFELRELNLRGGDERGEEACEGLNKEDALAYVAICRQKAVETLAGETRQILEGPSGFSYRKCSRAELHLYNIRHVQHHTGQMSAYLRRVDERLRDHKLLPWVGSGWR
jgi:hypothetical protein